MILGIFIIVQANISTNILKPNNTFVEYFYFIYRIFIGRSAKKTNFGGEKVETPK